MPVTPAHLVMPGWPGIIGQSKRYNPRSALGADLLAWWDADSRYWGNNGGITIATGISSWRDIVAAYDVVQATADAQPVFSATSFNGAPGVSFDGTDDVLTSTTAALLAALPADAVGSELWVLCQQDALAADTGVRFATSYGGNTTTVGRLIGRAVVTGVNRVRLLVGDGANNNLTGTAVDLSSRHVIRGQFAGGSNILTIDGGDTQSNAVTPTTTPISRLRIGSSNATTAANFWQGVIVAVLVVKPLSASKATALQNWLMSRRGL